MKIGVGVLAVQGAVVEHINALGRAAARRGMDIDVIAVRTPAELAKVSGLILPGGESTTISRLLRSGHLQKPILERAHRGDLAVFGTCAGLILLSSKATHDAASKDIELLGLLDAEVDRNAFGRQRDSFESDLDVQGVGKIPAVFIRAPVLTRTWPPTQVLAHNDRGIVAVRKGCILGTAFHPELTDDTRMHELFLTMVRDAAAVK